MNESLNLLNVLFRLSLSGSRARKKYSVTSLVSFSVTTDSEISPASSRRSSFITSSPDSSSEPPWSWVVLAGSFLCLSVLDGISYTFGMLLGPLMEALECGRSSVSAAGSLQVMRGDVISHIPLDSPGRCIFHYRRPRREAGHSSRRPGCLCGRGPGVSLGPRPRQLLHQPRLPAAHLQPPHGPWLR